MKINKVSDEKLAPFWTFGGKSLDEFNEQKAITKSEVERLNITKASKINEEILSKECDAIEKCAATSKTYHYNESWSEKDISHLKEYATACGLDSSKVKGINPEIMADDIKKIEQQASSSYMIKTASVGATAETLSIDKLKTALSDPFHIEERSKLSHMDKKNWQEVTKQANLAEVPSIISGSIKPLRGSESLFINSDPKIAINQNTIRNPDAIKILAESEKMDNGERLRKEREAREVEKKNSVKDWENNIVASMTKKDIVPKGVVFPTESLVANNGLSSPSSQMGVYAKFDKKDIPDLTAGEKIKASNDERRKSIQREEVAKEDFKMNKASTLTISDSFTDSLKKHLK